METQQIAWKIGDVAHNAAFGVCEVVGVEGETISVCAQDSGWQVKIPASLLERVQPQKPPVKTPLATPVPTPVVPSVAASTPKPPVKAKAQPISRASSRRAKALANLEKLGLPATS